jgi:hypothetical protein
MNLSLRYQTLEKEAIQRGMLIGLQAGIQAGRSEEWRMLVKTLFNSNLTELEKELSPILERMSKLPHENLPPEEIARLILQASREELVAKFSH